MDHDQRQVNGANRRGRHVRYLYQGMRRNRRLYRPRHRRDRRLIRPRPDQVYLEQRPRNRIGRRRPHQHAHLMFPRPKRALTGYLIFMRTVALEQPIEGGLVGRDLVREASTQWRLLSDERKAEFSHQAVEHRDEYLREMAIWKARKAELTRPGTAYSQFVKAVYERDGPAGRTFSEMGRHTAALWRGLTPEERQPYKDRHAELLEAFLTRLRTLNAEYRARDRWGNGGHDEYDLRREVVVLGDEDEEEEEDFFDADEGLGLEDADLDLENEHDPDEEGVQ